MERTNNTLWRLCRDFGMIALAEKLITGLGTTGGLKVKGYVEFVSSTPMTITPQYTSYLGVTLLYSLDGKTWTPIASGAKTPSANIIYFIGSTTGVRSLYASSSTLNAWKFTGATNLECNGKLDRLIQYNLGDDEDILVIDKSCFGYMFNNCTSLIKAPELPATTLANYCYANLFSGCTSLTTAPELPATTLATGCYGYMFFGCTSLITAPELPATTLANDCYVNMFRNTGITTAPALLATTLYDNCYGYMFNNSTSLTTAPELPATTLAINCYEAMFYGCTSLTTVPKLPATTLVEKCYQYMFRNCTSLKISETKTGIYDTAYRIPTSGTGTSGNTDLSYMFQGTGGTFTGTPTINTTYYTENTPV